jgi:hypothetical protein
MTRPGRRAPADSVAEHPLVVTIDLECSATPGNRFLLSACRNRLAAAFPAARVLTPESGDAPADRIALSAESWLDRGFDPFDVDRLAAGHPVTLRISFTGGDGLPVDRY